MPARVVAVAFLSCLAACEGSRTARPSLVKVDTLAGGVLSVRSDGPAWRDSSEAWRVVEEVRFGGAEGTPGELISPESFAVDAAGRVYVVDRKPSIVKVFNADGSFLRTMGREGRGPGEFQVGFIAIRGRHVAVHDPGAARTTVFDTSGTYVKSGVTFCCYWGDIMIDTTMRIVVPAFITIKAGMEAVPGVPYTRYSMDLALIDTMFVPEAREEEKVWMFTSADRGGKDQLQMSMLVPWAPRVTHALHPWGGVVRGFSNAFRVVRVPDKTDSTWVASIAWQAGTIPDAMRAARHAQAIKDASRNVSESRARATAKLEDMPTHAPAFTRLDVDENGNIWARQLVESDSTRTTFIVLDPQGRWLGTVRIPYEVEEYGGIKFGKGAVYAKTEDDEGRPTIVRLRVGPR